jgi:hypothetical protein
MVEVIATATVATLIVAASNALMMSPSGASCLNSGAGSVTKIHAFALVVAPEARSHRLAIKPLHPFAALMVGGLGTIGCLGPGRGGARRQRYAYGVMVGELHRLDGHTQYFNIARVDPIEMQPEVVVSWPTWRPCAFGE